MINALDHNIFLFEVDATEMCPNVNTEKGLAVLTLTSDNLTFKVEPNWPRRYIVTAIKFLLRFNVFQFRDTNYRQKRKSNVNSFHIHLRNFNIHYNGNVSTTAKM